MLLFTLRPFGNLGDNSDATTLMIERLDPAPGAALLWGADQILETRGFPATFSHVILYVRARTADVTFDRRPLYSDTKIIYTHSQPESGEIPDYSVPVVAFPEFVYATRNSGLLTSDTVGKPWTLDSITKLVVGASTLHTTSLFGIEGYLDIADVWVEAYGDQDEPIRRHKFQSGIYTMYIESTEYTAKMTDDEVRRVYETIHTLSGAGYSVGISLTARALDNLGIVNREPVLINSTTAQVLTALDKLIP